MDTYHIAEEPSSLNKRVRNSLMFTTVWLVGYCLIERFASGHWDHPVALAITGVVMFLGTLLTSSWWPRETSSFDLEVDDDEIRMVWKRKAIRRARRERVRNVREWKGIFGPRLVVSEHGSVGTRFLGRRVTVYKSLLAPDDYARIKAQTLSWVQSPEK
jgi:hypothetical protein